MILRYNGIIRKTALKGPSYELFVVADDQESWDICITKPRVNVQDIQELIKTLRCHSWEDLLTLSVTLEINIPKRTWGMSRSMVEDFYLFSFARDTSGKSDNDYYKDIMTMFRWKDNTENFTVDGLLIKIKRVGLKNLTKEEMDFLKRKADEKNKR